MYVCYADVYARCVCWEIQASRLSESHSVLQLLSVQLFVTVIPWTIAHWSPWNSPGKNAEAGCHFLLWGIFLTQGLNLGLLHCKQTPPSEPPGKSRLSAASVWGLSLWSALPAPWWPARSSTLPSLTLGQLCTKSLTPKYRWELGNFENYTNRKGKVVNSESIRNTQSYFRQCTLRSRWSPTVITPRRCLPLLLPSSRLRLRHVSLPASHNGLQETCSLAAQAEISICAQHFTSGPFLLLPFHPSSAPLPSLHRETALPSSYRATVSQLHYTLW